MIFCVIIHVQYLSFIFNNSQGRYLSPKLMHCAVFLIVLSVDINECNNYGTCQQGCTNSDGSFECYCLDGFTKNGQRCEVDGKHNYSFIHRFA